MIESCGGIRKAAILIDSLDDSTAEVLLAQMPRELAVQVRAARADLGDISPDEREQVLAEFLDAGLQPRPDSTQQPRDAADAAPAVTTATEPGPSPASTPGRRPDAASTTAPAGDPTDALASGLAQEDAQTICLVLAHLPPSRAAGLLQCLPTQRQAEVLQRLAQRESTPPEPQDHPGRKPDLVPFQAPDEEPFMAPVPCDHRREGRLTPRPAARRDGPGANQTESAEAASLADFDDLMRLEDAALARVFRAAAPQVVLLALSGANRELIERIARHLPAAAGRTLRRQIATLGPTRLRDIELAQQQLAELAGQMCRDGLIHVPHRRRFTMAA